MDFAALNERIQTSLQELEKKGLDSDSIQTILKDVILSVVKDHGKALTFVVKAKMLKLTLFLIRDDKDSAFALLEAATHGVIEIVKKMVDRVESTGFAIKMAARKGHFEVVKLLIEKSSKRDVGHALIAAISCDHLDLVKYLSDKVETVIFGFEVALLLGRMEMVKFLVAKVKVSEVSDEVIRSLFKRKDTDLVILLLDNGLDPTRKLSPKVPFPSTLLGIAVSNNLIEVIKILLHRGVKVEAECLDEVIRVGNLEMLVLLLDHGLEVKNWIEVLRMVNCGKYDEMLRFAAEKVDEEAILQLLYGVMAEHLEVDPLLNVVNLDKYATDILVRATQTSQLEVIKKVFDKADSSKHLDKISEMALDEEDFEFAKRLMKLGAKPSSIDERISEALIKRMDFELLASLLECGVDLQETLYLAILSDKNVMVKFLVELGVGIQERCLSMAVKRRNLELIRVLVENGASFDSDLLVFYAIRSTGFADEGLEQIKREEAKSLEILKYLLANGLEISQKIRDDERVSPFLTKYGL